MTRDLGIVIGAYIAALLVGFLALQSLPYSIIVNALIADLIATCVIFAFSRAFKNSSFYDAYWSVVPPLFAVYWLVYHGAESGDQLRGTIVVGLMIWWALRLTWNWASHWPGLSHEDWRYQPIRDKAGKMEFVADFFSTHLIPTLIVFACLLPVHAAINNPAPPVDYVQSGPWTSLNFIDYLAIIVTASAILIETISDIQLHKFNVSKKPGDIMRTGLWRFSRHPNYFGEFSFWFGLMLFGLAAQPQNWMWIVPGAALMFVLIRFASIPMMDSRSQERRKGYADHMKRTNAFVPWMPKP